jgi:hypothetical protein
MNGNQLTLRFEGYGRRIFNIGKPAEHGIQIWDSFSYVLIQMRKAMNSHCPGHTFRIEYFQKIAFKKHIASF